MLEDLGSVMLIGAGKMGGAMLRGWLAGGLPGQNVTIVDPAPADDIAALETSHGVTLAATLADASGSFDTLILAVKPQLMDVVLPALAATGLARSGGVVVSVAAGTLISTIEVALGGDVGVVRAMPNTPSAIGQGMTVCVANTHVSAAQRDACDQLVGAVGDVAWVDDEALIDAVTAVSGSGPAYVFHLAECMTDAGVAVGLPRALAAQLAQQTIAGAGALMKASDEEPSVLRQNVTSPNGTTAAALSVLMNEQALARLVADAIAAARDRSVELSKTS